MPKHFKWDEERDDELRTLFTNAYSDDEIADYFGLEAIDSIVRRRLKLRLLRRGPHGSTPWTKQQIKLLHETLHLSAEDAAQKTGKSINAIYAKRRELGLKSTYYKRWTPEQVQLLRELYPTYGSRLAAAKIKMPVKYVQVKAYNIGLRRER